MDQMFLEYYEAELDHIRSLATEFAALHPNVARNLALDTTPCADPYVERLLEGVAYLAARTRLKLDLESSKYVRNLIDTLYPDLGGPAPAMSLAEVVPGPQVERMNDGHVVRRGTRLISGLREGLKTRATYTLSEDVHLWPMAILAADHLQDRGALSRASIPDAAARDATSGLRFRLSHTGAGNLCDLTVDRLKFAFGTGQRGGDLFDAVFGFGAGAFARVADGRSKFQSIATPAMIGIDDETSILPRVRSSFEGYRLLREYFLMPERFYGMSLSNLSPIFRTTPEGKDVEITVLFRRETPELASFAFEDLRLFVTPVVNLFEHECNVVELRPGRASHIVHADRTRPKDYEIYRLLRVEDAEADGPEAGVTPLFSVESRADSGHVYSAERRPRRPDTEEVRRGQTRSSYSGDDFHISIGVPRGKRATKPIRRLDIRALCTNRDLPILDDSPTLTLETGDPVRKINLMGAMRRPRPSLRANLPSGASSGDRIDDLTWRWIGQLSLNHISLAAGEKDSEPLRALVQLYADRGDPALARHAESLTAVRSRKVIDRLALGGPVAFGHGSEITLDINEGLLTGGSNLLLSALLSRLFARHTAVNSFVHTKTWLTQAQTEIAWPMTPGIRAMI